jgi:Ca2+/Na+ antiporter
MFFPAIEMEQEFPSALRVLLYTLALNYIFLGITVIGGKFMEAIETITAKKLRKKDKKTGRIFTAMRWNDTVANLTLLALGSSAPEIVLATVEIFRQSFYEGTVGPYLIIGAAAFNLFVSVGICVVSVPSPDVRIVKATGAFTITAIATLIIYLWLFIITAVSSPDVIDIWEGVATLLFLPLLILISWLDDIGYLNCCRGKEGDEIEDEDGSEGSDIASDEGSEEGSEEAASSLEGANVVRDEDGNPIINPPGIISFEEDMMEVEGKSSDQTVKIKVARLNGSQGQVSCKYRTEKFNAVPGIDYEEQEGELSFEDGEVEAEIVLTVLSKKKWAATDMFQLILEDPDGGIIFNPTDDGGEECSLLTITINNDTEKKTPGQKFIRLIDSRILNLGECSAGGKAWFAIFWDTMTDIYGSDWNEATKFEWLMYITCLPWNLIFAIAVPPAIFCGGWVSFIACLGYIGVIATAMIDFAELLGCVAGLEYGIVGLIIVALGTSTPGMFLAKDSAVNEEFADASIVDVTSNTAVNVMMGLGMPWTIASIYWAATGMTAEWAKKYPGMVGKYPDAAFVVSGGNISFEAISFLGLAIVAIVVIKFRRARFGGELGGASRIKLVSTVLLIGLWVVFILLSFWKVQFDMMDVGPALGSMLTVDNIVFVAGVGVNIVYMSVSVSDMVVKFQNA